MLSNTEITAYREGRKECLPSNPLWSSGLTGRGGIRTSNKPSPPEAILLQSTSARVCDQNIQFEILTLCGTYKSNRISAEAPSILLGASAEMRL
jgi:hypothetical protein